MLPNYIDKFFTKSGRYFIMLGQALKRPQKMRVFSKLYFREVDDLGFNSMGIVAFPTTYVFDRNGTIVGEPIVGSIKDGKNLEKLQKTIDEAIAKSAAK